MSDAPSQATSPRGSNVLHRRVVVIATALSLATAYGWMASFERQPGGQVDSHWSWTIPVWGLIGLGSSIYFWQELWPPENRPRATRRKIVFGSLVLLVPGVWWLTFPLRFLSGQTFWDVTIGLVAAALVLCFGAWMVIKLINAFEQSDAINPADPESTHTKATATVPTTKGEATGN